ncbi:hypothetical protein F4677DRAFT_449807 [Hypoxylon crocopeplum]|nr:hypothetical protein F4677DRAFT_449807 [Hypoxylon crocopeplum]
MRTASTTAIILAVIANGMVEASAPTAANRNVAVDTSEWDYSAASPLIPRQVIPIPYSELSPGPVQQQQPHPSWLAPKSEDGARRADFLSTPDPNHPHDALHPTPADEVSNNPDDDEQLASSVPIIVPEDSVTGGAGGKTVVEEPVAAVAGLLVALAAAVALLV